MKNPFPLSRLSLSIAASTALFVAGIALAADVKVNLSGDQEVPAVKTAATATGTFSIGADKSVSGSVSTKGIQATAAHIHEGASGSNGNVIVPLTKGNDDTFTVPAGAKLTDAQYAEFQAGKLYVNVHSAANPGGEIRAQLKP